MMNVCLYILNRVSHNHLFTNVTCFMCIMIVLYNKHIICIMFDQIECLARFTKCM